MVHMNKDDIQEERIMVQGGDIRQRGNQWLRKAWQKSGVTRVPREAEFRKIVRSLASQYNLCSTLPVNRKFAQFDFYLFLYTSLSCFEGTSKVSGHHLLYLRPWVG